MLSVKMVAILSRPQFVNKAHKQIIIEPPESKVIFLKIYEKKTPYNLPVRTMYRVSFVSSESDLFSTLVIVMLYVLSCCTEVWLYLGRVMEVWLSCYLVLLSVDSKTR